MNGRPYVSRRTAASGLSVIEVMISLVLGLVIVGSAFTVFLSNRQTYRVAEALARIQEASRWSFEFMARDLRAAGVNPCQADVPIYNVLNNAGTVWWSSLDATGRANEGFLRGFSAAETLPGIATGGDPNERVAGTDAIQVLSAQARGVFVAVHNPRSTTVGSLGATTFQLNTTNHGFVNNDIALVCDFGQGAIFQVNGAVAGSNLISHAVSGTPGNSRTRLDAPVSTVNYRYGCFLGLETADGSACREQDLARVDPPRQWPAMITELTAARWYVINNARGNASLVREGLQNIGGTLSLVSTEVVDNVAAFNLQYLVGNAYVPAGSVTDWTAVSAVRVSLSLESDEIVGDDGVTRASRDFVYTLNMRGRTP